MIRRVIPFFLLLVFVPGFALAAQFKSGDTVTVGRDQTIQDDLYVGSGNVTIDGTVDGDLIAGGGSITITGVIKGDLVVAGGNIIMRGQVGDDARIAGGQISIEGTISDDLMVAGGMVTISQDASILGDVKAAGGQISIAGKTGSVEVASDDFSIRNTAIINGNVRYWGQKDAKVDSAATINGTVKKEAVPQGSKSPFGRINPLLATILGIVVTAFFAWLLSYFFPNKTESILASSGKEIGVNLLWGFLALIGIPAIAILLCITVVGTPAAVLLLLAFPVILALGWLVAVLMTGYAVNMLLTKQPASAWIYGLAGAAVLTLLSIVPFIGWLVTTILFLAGLGSLLRFDWGLYNRLREEKKI